MRLEMILYRAMCESEYQRSVRTGTADFSEKRFKYFSQSLEFITERVRDGKFNNSKFVPERYSRLVSFEIPDSDLARCRVYRKEIELDRRKNVRLQLREVLR